LIQFARGPEAEREYGLCPGVVAFLITTKRPSTGSGRTVTLVPGRPRVQLGGP